MCERNENRPLIPRLKLLVRVIRSRKTTRRLLCLLVDRIDLGDTGVTPPPTPSPLALLSLESVVIMSRVFVLFVFMALTCCVGRGSNVAGGGNGGSGVSSGSAGVVGGDGTKETGTATTSPVFCGPIPDSVHSCLGDLQLVPPGVVSKCPVSKTPTQCSKFSCVASHAGWTDAVGWLDRQKIGEFFTRWAATRPQWTRAVDRVRSTCLAGQLPPQGTYLYCPAYDIFYCALAVLYKNAEASAWRTGTQCEQARAFVMACPICPSECFAPTIPINSCNLCKKV